MPTALRRGQEIDVGDRVLLLMSTITITIFNFISQVSVSLPSPDCFRSLFCNPKIMELWVQRDASFESAL